MLAVGLHVDCLVSRVRLVLGRTNVHAKLTPGAVLGSDLDGVSEPRVLLAAVSVRLEGSRRAGERRRLVKLGPDGGVGTNEGALVALNTNRGIPDGDLVGDVALFPLRGSGGPGPVHRKGAHREQIPIAGNHHRGHPLDEIGRLLGHRGGRKRLPPAAAGTETWCKWSSAASTAAWFRRTTSAPF
jgi:hypothetical protein